MQSLFSYLVRQEQLQGQERILIIAKCNMPLQKCLKSDVNHKLFIDAWVEVEDLEYKEWVSCESCHQCPGDRLCYM